MASSAPATPDTLVALKIDYQGEKRRHKLKLSDLSANVFEEKVREYLRIAPEALAVFERYSDSASSYIELDPSNQSVWKQLLRAAKAKQKLKLRVTLPGSEEHDHRPRPATVEDESEQDSQNFAQTKPEAPLISTAASETSDPIAEAIERSSTATAGLTLLQMQQDQMQKMHNAMSRLSLAQHEAMQQLDAPSPASTTSLCVAPKAANFAVCCNNCDRTVPDAHYHCSTCDDGDFDLCPRCVEMGVTCYNADHWLLKRFVRGDSILVSTTERVAPKPKVPQSVQDVPLKEETTMDDEFLKNIGAKPVETTAAPTPPAYCSYAPAPFRVSVPMRTCNSCVQELPDKEFLHCTSCADFDLCKDCFKGDQHGHHPQHGFVPAVEGTPMPSEITRRLAPGRDQRHHAICDGCDKFIFGVRHKCLDCPDWDYCASCVVNAAFIHPNHRFVPIYDQIADARTRSTSSRPCHYGICCDGPLCNGKRKVYIVGDRYKCSVCHDTDFCASCEASPANNHNRTHPLIKLKTPVRRVEVTTKGEDAQGQKMHPMGDRLSRKPVSSRATETAFANKSATTSLHTVVDVKPEPEPAVKKIESSVPSSVVEATKVSPTTTPTVSPSPPELIAVFERDTIADGTVMPPNQVFEQTWVLRNQGRTPWPAGCSVRFVGGDYMGHVDSSRPADTRELVSTSKSTVSYDAVAPGQEFAFTVRLRTPAREGKVISWWRLSTKDGHKFGHKLWCDVTVQAPQAVEAAPAAPAEAEKETPEVAASSQMIFPTLEKESPETSIHQDIRSETAEVVEEDGFEFEDGEDDEWDEDSDDGFLTDEEYDILDASDEELVDEPKTTSK